MSINKRKEEFRKYPNMLKLYLRGGQKFMESGHGEKARERWGGDVYRYLMADLFVDRPNKNTLHEFAESLSGGLFPDQGIDAKQFLEDYFEVNLDI